MERKNFNWKDPKLIIIACSLVLNLILGSMAYTYYGQAADLEEIQHRNDNLIAENVSLQDENANLQTQVDELQPTIDDLNAQVQSLTTEKTDLQNQVTQLTDNNKNLQSQIDSLKSSSGSSSGNSSSSSSSVTAASSTPQSRTVYITNTGSKYHRSGCRYLSKSKNAISLSEAQRLGYTACSVCGG